MRAVAIDGPAGAGKSTIARAVAKEIGFMYVDTGALYRAIGLGVKLLGLDTTNHEQVTEALDNITVTIKFVDGEQRVFLNGHDVSDEIRTSEMGFAASDVSAIGTVREFLFSLQKNMAAKNDVVMDGRDIGTVVLPDADVKIFLTASTEERARRRYEEFRLKGSGESYEQVLNDVKERDYADSHRAISPLICADDAVFIDTTGEPLKHSIERIKNVILEKLG